MIPDDITLRPVRDPDDLPFLLEVYRSVRAPEMALLDWPDKHKQAFIAQQFQWQHRQYTSHYDNARFDVVERGGVGIGRLYVRRGADDIRIIDIALLPDWRGRGIGGALLGEILAEAGDSGRTVSIHVEKMNPAMALYRRLGFVKTADADVYDLMEWRPA